MPELRQGRQGGARQLSFAGTEIPVKLLSIELIKCVHCGNVDPVIPSLDGLMDLVALNLISSRSLLTGGEVRFLRKYIGKSAQDFARLVHVDHTHLLKIENGRVVIGGGLDKLVRLVVLLSSPGLRRKRKELLGLLPEIEDVRRPKAEGRN